MGGRSEAGGEESNRGRRRENVPGEEEHVRGERRETDEGAAGRAREEVSLRERREGGRRRREGQRRAARQAGREGWRDAEAGLETGEQSLTQQQQRSQPLAQTPVSSHAAGACGLGARPRVGLAAGKRLGSGGSGMVSAPRLEPPPRG
ncbi:hypothetical protein KIL84_013140 [Mauremys mutica]|uniref:Uncharacterized protein n=1 Tax=Mauremys mutica TaxID=74926 RepID=A0A9D3WX70_9SAUR|nr:hypothetical protein KIL84_013140 [Mauremys mutica]